MGLPILSVKDVSGNIIDIPVIQGRPGPKGDPGEVDYDIVAQEIRNYIDEVGGGTSKPDITLRGLNSQEIGSTNFTHSFGFEYDSVWKFDPGVITFDQEELVKAYEKGINKEPISAVLLAPISNDSSSGWSENYYPANLVASVPNRQHLVIRFKCNDDYWINIGSQVLTGTEHHVQYVFTIDPINRTANIYNAYGKFINENEFATKTEMNTAISNAVGTAIGGSY